MYDICATAASRTHVAQLTKFLQNRTNAWLSVIDSSFEGPLFSENGDNEPVVRELTKQYQFGEDIDRSVNYRRSKKCFRF